MVFSLSVQCDNVEDLKKSIRELMDSSVFESNCCFESSDGYVIDYSFVDTDDVFHDEKVKIIPPWGQWEVPGKK